MTYTQHVIEAIREHEQRGYETTAFDYDQFMILARMHHQFDNATLGATSNYLCGTCAERDMTHTDNNDRNIADAYSRMV